MKKSTALQLLMIFPLMAGFSDIRTHHNRISAALAQRIDTVVRTAGTPRHRGVGKLVEEVSIGSESGPNPYIFGRISELRVAPDSSVYVFDYSVPVLRKFDAAGKYVRALGRGGQGPGEYGRVAGMAVARDGRVLLRDPSNDRILVYSATGESVENWTNGGSRLYTGDALQMDVNGIVYTKAKMSAQLGNGETGFIRMGTGGKIIDTLAPPRFSYKPQQIQGVTGMSISIKNGAPDTVLARGGIALPFAPQQLWSLSPLGYFVTGVPNRYAFELRIPQPGDASGRALQSATRSLITPVWSEGSSVVSIRLPNTVQVKVDREERDLRRKQTEDGQRRSDPRWQWEGPDIPTVKPYYKAFDVGLDGNIYVSLHTAGERYIPTPAPARAGAPAAAPSAAYREPVVYDIFEPSGTYVGQVAVPLRHSVYVWWGEKAWGTVTDENGVQTVKRWRIVWSN